MTSSGHNGKSGGQRGGAATVLLVEDEPVLRASMARGLSRLPGVETVDAGTFRDALALLDVGHISLVVSDIDLPDGSGIELIGELGRRRITAPIIFVTAYLKAYRSQIPPHANVLVLEKPVPLEELRVRVLERLGQANAEARAPFSVADYLQLACIGRHSLVIEVEESEGGGAHSLGKGRVVVNAGEVWSAQDVVGHGPDAFERLAFAANAVVGCHALVGDPGPRNITARWEALLMEAARKHDEANHAAPDREQVVMPREDEVSELIELSLDEPEDDSPEIEVTAIDRGIDARFGELWDAGVDALLGHDYAGARRAFLEAKKLRPGDARVEANLSRLQAMGFGEE